MTYKKKKSPKIHKLIESKKKNPVQKIWTSMDSKWLDDNPHQSKVILASSQQQNLLQSRREALSPLSAASESQHWFDFVHLNLPLIK